MLGLLEFEFLLKENGHLVKESAVLGLKV